MDQTRTTQTQDKPVPVFAVLDIETTGLDVRENVILEIGCILLDAKLNEVASFSTVINDNRVLQMMNKIKNRAAINGDADAKFIFNMHKDSGLWAEIVQHPEIVSEELARNRFERWLSSHGLQPLGTGKSTTILAGSSVHFDVDYLNAYMPSVIERFHYRRLDVSGFKVAVDHFEPKLKQKRDAELTKGNHRVLPDCRASIAELKWYMENVMGADLNA